MLRIPVYIYIPFKTWYETIILKRVFFVGFFFSINSPWKWSTVISIQSTRLNTSFVIHTSRNTFKLSSIKCIVIPKWIQYNDIYMFIIFILLKMISTHDLGSFATVNHRIICRQTKLNSKGEKTNYRFTSIHKQSLLMNEQPYTRRTTTCKLSELINHKLINELSTSLET